MKTVLLIVCTMILVGCNLANEDIGPLTDTTERYTLVRSIKLQSDEYYQVFYDSNPTEAVLLKKIVEYNGFSFELECPIEYIIRKDDKEYTTCQLADELTVHQYHAFGFNVKKLDKIEVSYDTIEKQIFLISGEVITVMRYPSFVICVEGIKEIVVDEEVYVIEDPCPYYFLINGERISNTKLFNLVNYNVFRYNSFGVGRVGKSDLK